MAGELTITKCRLVKGDEDCLFTRPIGEAGTQGMYYRQSSAGKLEKGNASSATELGGPAGLLLDDADTVNMPGTIVLLNSNAIVDLGEALAGASIGAKIYVSDTDASIATSAGTTSRVIGDVIGLFNNSSGTADKLLQLTAY